MAKTKAKLLKRKITKNIYVTSTGLINAKKEYEYLTKTKRQEIAERIQKAREFGDLSENSEYGAAMDEQSIAENRISDLENILKSVQVIKPVRSSDFVVIGSTVKVEMDDGIDEFTIVGRVEADPAKKRISNESPLGASLLGAKVGESVEVTTPIIKYRCKVLEIR